MDYYDKLIKLGVFIPQTKKPHSAAIRDGVASFVLTLKTGETRTVLVDAEDFENLVLPYRWGVNGVKRDRVYACGKIGKKKFTILLHRWLFNPPADKEVDHVNRNSLDNRRENLREVTRKQNEENGPATASGKSQYRGVYFDAFSSRWRGEVTHNYKTHKSRRFKTEEEARDWAIEKRAELYTHCED